MRSLLLSLGLLAAPLPFISAAEAQTGPPCCQSEGEAHPPDPHNPGPIFVPAEVRRRDERALEAAAEAPVVAEVPLANAIAMSLDEDEDAVVVPVRQPIPMPPCCQMVEAETHPPDPHREEVPLVLVGAEVNNRNEESLVATVALPIPAERQRVDAIGVPLEARRGVSEPGYRPAPGLVLMLLLLLAIGFSIRWPRRRPTRLKDHSAPQRPRLPDEILRPDIAPVSFSEPTRAPVTERELELV